jgi:hypothetical protein
MIDVVVKAFISLGRIVVYCQLAYRRAAKKDIAPRQRR